MKRQPLPFWTQQIELRPVINGLERKPGLYVWCFIDSGAKDSNG
ncbi:hypothetical protein AB4Z29_17295 [Paenibacillus sp. 2TAB23]